MFRAPKSIEQRAASLQGLGSGLYRPRGLKDFDSAEFQLSEQEEENLKENLSIFSQSIANYAAWRASRIRLALVPFALYIVLTLLTCIGLRPTAAETLTSVLDEKYHQHFTQLYLMAKIERYCVLVSSIIAWLMGFAAVDQCRRLRFDVSSVRWVRRCVCVTLLTPFMLVLFVPFRDGIDVDALRLDACHDFITAIKSKARQSVQHDFVLSYMLEGLVDEDHLRANFCDKDASTWGVTFLEYISAEDGNFVIEEECPSRQIPARRLTASQMDQSEVMDLASCTANCDLSHCSGSCPLFLAPLSLLVAEHGEEEVARDEFAMVSGSAACNTCFEETLRLGCIQRCAAHRRLEGFKICITGQEFRDVKMLADVVSHITLEKVLLGLLFALKSLIFLIPLALAIVTGILRGGSNAHNVLTQSRFPGFISLAVSTVTLPFSVVLLAFLQNFMGNEYTGVSVILFVMNYVIGTKFWLVIPASEQLLCIFKSTLFRWALRILMIAFLLVGVLANGVAREATSIIISDYVERQHDSFILRVVLQVADIFLWNAFAFVLVYFGQSFILSVFFADGFVALTYYFQRSEAQQSDEVREELWEQIECLRKVLDPEQTESIPRLQQARDRRSEYPVTSFFCTPR